MTSNIHEASSLSSSYADRDTMIALDASALGYTRKIWKCHDTDQGIRCVYSVTVSTQGLQY